MSIQSPTEKSQIAMQAKTQAIPPRELGDDLPSGGTVGQVLTKTATGSEWADVPEELPEGGSNGQFLKKTADGPAWGSIPEELPDYSQETAGKVLTVVEGATAEDPNEVSWENPATELPAGGTAGQVLKKTANGCEWGDAPGGLPSTSNSNKGQYLKVNPSNNSAYWTNGPTMLGSTITFTTSECFFDPEEPGEDPQQPVDNNVKVTLALASGSSWPTLYDGDHFTPQFVRIMLKDSNNYVYAGLLAGIDKGSEFPGSQQIRLHGKLDLTSKSGSTSAPWGPYAYGYLDVILIKNQTSYWLYVTSKSELEDPV